MEFTIWGRSYLDVSYRGLDDRGNESSVAGYFLRHPVPQPQPINTRAGALVDAFDALPRAEPVGIEIDGSLVQVQPRVHQIQWSDGVITLNLEWPGTEEQASIILGERDLTPAQRRLLQSVVTTVDRMAWEDLRGKIGTTSKSEKPQVFISYRSGHEIFAQALAERLGKEGFLPWFDRWDIRAGDSVPGKIEQAFRDSEAFIPVITADYEEGKWATDELMTAITKRLEEGYRIVPVLLEACEKPELIKHLRHVDFSAQDPETYETKVAELIDGIYALELNPFR